jgi:hypothetical protein
MNTLELLQQLREALYNSLPKRRDAILELIDTIASHGHQANSIVELSEFKEFTREYTSITDAIANGLTHVDFKQIEKIVFYYCSAGHKHQYHLFGTDVTAHPRLYAKKLKDRSIVHSPNVTPGQKPIVLGHQYSVTSWLPKNKDDKNKHWILPITTDRVPSEEKPHEFGITQVINMIKNLDLSDELVVCVSDSAYGTENCRKTAESSENLVHVFRLKGNRNVFDKPCKHTVKQKKYGHKMSLGNVQTHGVPDEKKTTKHISSKGKLYHVTVYRWNDRYLRGSRSFKGYTHPFDVLKVEMRPIQQDGTSGEIIGKPMWLVSYGQRRREISTLDIYRDYAQRFDLEHFFRFGKNNLLLTSYQTPDHKHEELFSKICIIAYAQLFLARNDVNLHLKPWEKYNKALKYTNCKTLSPPQVQRTFSSVLEKVSTPALPAKKRGISKGRKAGYKVKERDNQDIVFKTKPVKQRVTIELSGLEKTKKFSKVKSLVKHCKTLLKTVKNMGFTFKDLMGVLNQHLSSG